MACAASPISVTRDGVQAGAGSRYPNGITKIELRSMRSTMPRSAGSQPSMARSMESRSMAGVSPVHSPAGGMTVPGATLQLTIR